MSFQLPKTCGVNLNLNNLRGELQNQAFAVLNINLGTPSGLQDIANTIEGKLSTLKDQVAAQLPEIPEEIKSLRGDLAALASMTAGSFASVQKMATIAADYVGLSDIQGFANININDLASSVFSIGGTFDPCSMTIPNINLTPDGLLQKLPSIQPDLGSITKMVPIAIPDQSITDNLSNALKNNTQILSSQSVAVAQKAIESNVSNAITGMGDMVRKLPSGQQVVEMRDDFITRIKQERLELMSEQNRTEMDELVKDSW